ncbi:uncharacterized protein LOC129958597 isoform X4 [Argiope bruennichi]|uniref:uncharacterized protein LOC129958597 isoform X4 n=1 Tax=Argiope bruennichi TaxID=94029 RepID=UPI0024959A49|nr:uncharacterized protein LOC129958597 isoform X4 [Argiope bruennichi]
MGPPNRPNDIEIVHSLHDLRLKYAKMEINILQNCPYKDVKKDYKPFCHFLERLECVHVILLSHQNSDQIKEDVLWDSYLFINLTML